MKFQNLNLKEYNNEIHIDNIKDFIPKHIFECGQSFRWQSKNDESYTGVAFGKKINVSFIDNKLIIKNSNIEDFKNIWFDYFDLERDYSEIKKVICKDEIMAEAIEFGKGIRLLKQDFNEILISFIISANNSIPRIMKSVELLSIQHGNDITGENKFYSFPTLEQISKIELEQLIQCKAGFRCKYFKETSKMILNGTLNLNDIENMSALEARNELMKLNGVGAKVADCVLLFSGMKYDIFPTDLWVKRVMEKLYFKREASLKEIWNFSKDYFGKYAGFAQQYLFYYARENKIG